MKTDHRDLLFKELCQLLPYGVEFIHRDETFILFSVGHYSNENPMCITGITPPKDGVSSGKIDVFLQGCQPLLLPLSALTEEIEHNGKKFVPYVELLRDCNFDVDNMKKEDIEYYKPSEQEKEWVESRMYAEVSKLIEWHFDISGLIPKGLAIDKRTV